MTELLGVKRDYRAVSYALVSAVVGIIVMRIIVYFVPFGPSYGDDLAATALFALPVQLLFLLAVPFLIYKFYGRKSVRGVLKFSSWQGFKPYFLLAIPVGFCVYFLTVGISSAWAALLELTGYTYTSSSVPMPAEFNFGFFIAEVFMTALLPAVCEEFAMRGGLLTTANKTFGTVGCVVLCGVAFGLFHQNVKQVFYTALFGALTAFLTLRLKSVFPAMIIHFVNNFCSVFFDYAGNYGWATGGLWSGVNMLALSKPWALALVYLSVTITGGGLVFLMLYLKEKRVVAKKMEVIKDSGFDVTNRRVVLMGELDENRVSELEMEKEVYGADYSELKYKPTARDIMIPIALGVVTLLTTVFTYVWGFFY